MNVYEEHADALRELMDSLAGDCPVIWWNGKNVRVLPTSVKKRSENAPGGYGISFDLQFTTFLSEFGTTIPESNQPFNYPGSNGDAFKILNIDPMPGGLQVRITANAANQEL